MKYTSGKVTKGRTRTISTTAGRICKDKTKDGKEEFKRPLLSNHSAEKQIQNNLFRTELLEEKATQVNGKGHLVLLMIQ